MLSKLRVLVALSAALCVAGLGCTSAARDDASGSVIDVNAHVVRIVDGDTLIADIGGSEESVRLIGFDTPESVDPATEVECFGPEASSYLQKLLPEGSPIRIERDIEERDRYERLLGYVHRGSDGLFINLEMLERGYADTLSIKPNTTHDAEFRNALRSARAESLGMWGACDL